MTALVRDYDCGVKDFAQVRLVVRVRVGLIAFLCAAGLAVTGCHGNASAGKAAAGNTKPFAIRGKIVSVDASAGEADIDAQDIPGLMDAMTMSYKFVDPSVLSELHPGDTISAQLLVDYDAAGPKDMRVTDVVVVGQAKADYKPAVQYHIPAPGDEVPDFALLNQSDRKIDLKQYRGKLLLVTFIYTRCPLSDYCPRMSRNFAEIDKDLQGDASLYKNTHLLSVSFDPTNDTPKVLKSYGAAYTGRYVKETFDHWEFAAPPVAELPKMEQWFGVGVTPGESGTLQHSLSTVLIGKDGKVVAFWPTNDWSVQDVLAKVKAAAG